MLYSEITCNPVSYFSSIPSALQGLHDHMLSEAQASSHLKQQGCSMLLIAVACSQHLHALLTVKAQGHETLHFLVAIITCMCS